MVGFFLLAVVSALVLVGIVPELWRRAQVTPAKRQYELVSGTLVAVVVGALCATFWLDHRSGVEVAVGDLGAVAPTAAPSAVELHARQPEPKPTLKAATKTRRPVHHRRASNGQASVPPVPAAPPAPPPPAGSPPGTKPSPHPSPKPTHSHSRSPSPSPTTSSPPPSSPSPTPTSPSPSPTMVGHSPGSKRSSARHLVDQIVKLLLGGL